MSKIILSPLTAPIAIIFYIGLIFLYCALNVGAQPADFIFHFTENGMEVLTYSGYLVSFIIVLALYKDFQTSEFKGSYLLFLFLTFCAVLREMGVQHWIPSQDTTAFKLRFFTNPDNPIGEKLLSAFLLVTVAGVIIYLLVRYLPRLIKGFFAFNPICWTVCSLGGIGVLCKIADRFPSNYWKSTGEQLDINTHAWIELFEESSEATLPLLFAFAVIQ
ncbi:MAG: hypothetical protein ACI4QM_03510, partial [Alphaproteobacteria bacterium]